MVSLALPRHRLLLRKPPYSQKVLSVRPQNLVGYWPLNEGAGTVARDLSPQGNNGAYTGVTLNGLGIGDGHGAPYFDATNDYCDIYSAALAADFSGAELTAMVWVKVAAVSVWTDSASRFFLHLQVDGNNRLALLKTTSANELQWYYVAGSTIENVQIAGHSDTDYMCIAATASATANAFKAYKNGKQQGSTQTTLGTWAGSLASTTTVIGSLNTTPGNVMHGWLAHVAIWNVALTAGEIAYLGRL